MPSSARSSPIFINLISSSNQQQRPDLPRLLQQMHAQQIPGAHGAPPMPVGMPHPSLGPGALGGPLGALGSTPPQHPLAILNKQELHRPEESKSSNSNIMPLDDRHVSMGLSPARKISILALMVCVCSFRPVPSHSLPDRDHCSEVPFHPPTETSTDRGRPSLPTS